MLPYKYLEDIFPIGNSPQLKFTCFYCLPTIKNKQISTLWMQFFSPNYSNTPHLYTTSFAFKLCTTETVSIHPI